jgi:transketolase
MATATKSIERLAIDTIRTLAMDAVQAANSGHPGTPMALAPVAYTLYNEVLRYDPAHPAWPARDRFVLSCGHASMLLYSLLHLTGVRQLDAQGRPTGEPAVSLDDIRRFRQLDSRCPGHPEYGHTTGVEVTTGPLGQGISNSVGMAIASRWLAARFNRPGLELFDFNVYALCSDGDLMEGISGEAASLAGHLKLDNLCWIYDDNGITIEGHTTLAFSEDVARRFAGYGWNVLKVADVNDLDALRAALSTFRQTTGRPTLVIVRSVIAWGAPHKQNTHGAHGAPLGADEVRLTKLAYGWPEDQQFLVPEEVLAHFREGIQARGAGLHDAWKALLTEYRRQYPALADELDRMRQRELPAGWDADLPTFPADAKGMASRVSSGKVLNQLAKNVPWLLGGSADLAPSTNTLFTFAEAGDLAAGNPGGRNFHFGIREHAMGAICSGITTCGLRAFGATFFVFSDYMRPPIRLAAMMGLPTIYVFTHDSIGVGEDGPTHQPVEQLAALRAIPGLIVLRPADANEVVEAYKVVMQLKNKPAALVLTRQNLPTLDRAQYAPAAGVERGGYVLADAPDARPEAILIGTGSEVSLCVEAHRQLAAEGIKTRVVSMPSWELFDAQSDEYRNAVLPPAVTARVAAEAGVEFGWQKYLGPSGRFVGMRGFGASGPYGTLMKHFGLTPAHLVAHVKQVLAGVMG